ncbi:MAG: GNAT family N-acetyltransferase [Calditrichaeota bacterium]|nr:GNAT family N-acetyltransferase [Calditrichota bacterium]
MKNQTREKWLNDPLVKKFLSFGSSFSSSPLFEKPAFVQNFEIYLDKKLIGDIKVFGNNKDIKKHIAQVLMVLGESRGKGVGTKALELLLDSIKGMYDAVYCNVNRYNIASIKMLRKNGFRIKRLVGNEVVLYKTLSLKNLKKVPISI